ncbi:MAG: serine hydrolase [Candidatus Bipolaricaulia bacterium]
MNQLNQYTDSNVREILERELFSYQMLFASVGRGRLEDIQTQTQGYLEGRLAALGLATDVDPKVYDGYVGQYEVPAELAESELPFPFIAVTREDDKLYVDLSMWGGPMFELFPRSETSFFHTDFDGDEVDFEVTFITDETGQVTQAVLEQEGQTFTFKRINAQAPPTEVTDESEQDTVDNDNEPEYVSPEEVGWSSEKLEEAGRFAEQIGSAAVMAVYDGKVFFSWGEVTRNFLVHSIRKPFPSALYGIHVERGEIDLDATMEDLNIDDIPPSLTAEEKQAKVSDLLKSRSGVYHEAAAEAQSMIDSRPERGSHPPGAFYYYNNWDFAESTTSYSVVDSASGQGYGYLWKVAPEGSELAQSVGHPFYYHTGIGVHVLAIVPDLKLVLVHRVNTDVAWSIPDEAIGQLFLMIMNARLSK